MVGKITVESTYSGITFNNTFHYNIVTPPLVGRGMADLLTLFLSKVKTPYKAVLGTDVTLVGASATEEVAPGSGAIPEHAEQALNEPGTMVGGDHFIPPQMCALARFPSDAAVRGSQGRAFLPPPMTSGALGVGGIWKNTHAYWTGCVALVNELKNGFHAGGWWTAGWDAEMVVYSRTRRAAGQPNYWFSVINGSVDPKQHWLRSRAD